MEIQNRAECCHFCDHRMSTQSTAHPLALMSSEHFGCKQSKRQHSSDLSVCNHNTDVSHVHDVVTIPVSANIGLHTVESRFLFLKIIVETELAMYLAVLALRSAEHADPNRLSAVASVIGLVIKPHKMPTSACPSASDVETANEKSNLDLLSSLVTHAMYWL